MAKKKPGKEVAWIIKDKHSGKITPELQKDLARLKNKEPVDYIIGWKPFLGCKIDLSFRPLIPRPETEFWTEKAISEIGRKKLKVLDLFAGSGCVGIAILKHCPLAKVDFAEIDKKLIEQIKLNLKLNKIKRARYKIIRSDIFSGINKKYDFILANPPYIPKTRGKHLASSVLKYEPRLALFGGKTGLRFITGFLKRARKYLTKNGQIWLEFGYGQKSQIEKVIKESGYSSWVFKKDQYNRWRYVVITLE